MKYNKDTSDKILNTAFDEFGENGFSGARMQRIADKAGINKALLHYYYKSKDALFEIVMKQAVKIVAPKLLNVVNEQDSIFESIEKFVSKYIEILIKNPHIPGFVIHEISHNPKRLIRLIEGANIKFEKVKERLQKEMDAGVIVQMQPEQLIVNILSMCIFPFIAKPMVTGLILDGNQKEFKAMMESRKKDVTEFVIRAIKVEK